MPNRVAHLEMSLSRKWSPAWNIHNGAVFEWVSYCDNNVSFENWKNLFYALYKILVEFSFIILDESSKIVFFRIEKFFRGLKFHEIERRVKNARENCFRDFYPRITNLYKRSVRKFQKLNFFKWKKREIQNFQSGEHFSSY